MFCIIWNSQAAIYNDGQPGQTRGNIVWWTHRAGTDVPDLAAFDHVVQRLHNLFHWHVTIQAVELKNINVRAQSRHAGVNRIEDMLPRQAALVDPLAVINSHAQGVHGPARLVHVVETLGHDHDLGPWYLVVTDGFADDFLRHSVGVDIGNVPSVDTPVKGVL